MLLNMLSFPSVSSAQTSGLLFGMATDSLRTASWFSAAYRYGLQKVSRPEDHEDVKAQNLLTALLGLLCAAFGIPWAIIYASLGLTWAAVAVAVTALVLCTASGHVLCTKRNDAGLSAMMIGMTLGCLVVNTMFGGGAGSAGAVACAHIAPSSAVVLGGQTRLGTGLLVLTVVGSLATSIMDLALSDYLPSYELRHDWYVMFHWMNVNARGVITFVTVLVAVHQIEKSKRVLRERQLHVEELNEQLRQQQHKLRLEQRLARSLIGNVFPETVAGTLIHLFERCAEEFENDRQRHRRARPVRCRTSSLDPPPRIPTLVVLDSSGKYDASDSDSAPSSNSSMAGDPHRLPPITGPCPAPGDLVGEFMLRLAPKSLPRAVVLFSDIVGFTATASLVSATTLVYFLDQVTPNRRRLPSNRWLPSNRRRPPSNRRRLPSNRRRLPSNRWLPTNHRPLPCNRRRLPSNRRQLPSNRRRLPSNRRRLPSNRWLPTNHRPLPCNRRRLPSNRRRLPSNRRRLPSNRRRLPSNRWLPTNHRPLPCNRRRLPSNRRQLPSNRRRLPSNRRRLPSNRWLPTNHRPLPCNRRRLPSNRRRLPSNRRRLPSNRRRLPSNRWLPTNHRPLPCNRRRLPSNRRQLPSNRRRLPSNRRRLPSNRWLPTNHRPLPCNRRRLPSNRRWSPSSVVPLCTSVVRRHRRGLPTRGR